MVTPLKNQHGTLWNWWFVTMRFFCNVVASVWFGGLFVFKTIDPSGGSIWGNEPIHPNEPGINLVVPGTRCHVGDKQRT